MQNTYIKITEEDEDDNYSPSDNEVLRAESELMLDINPAEEYNTPYTTYGDDLTFDVGGVIETGGIFDDR